MTMLTSRQTSDQSNLQRFVTFSPLYGKLL